MNGNLFAGVFMNKNTLLNLDKNYNMYFNTSHAWESFQINSSLYTATDLAASTTSGQIIITISEHLAEVSSKILVYLIQVLEIPEAPKNVDKESTEGMMFTVEELEALESVTEKNFKSFIPSDINDVHVNANPK